jgi:hypothetical protein
MTRSCGQDEARGVASKKKNKHVGQAGKQIRAAEQRSTAHAKCR